MSARGIRRGDVILIAVLLVLFALPLAGAAFFSSDAGAYVDVEADDRTVASFPLSGDVTYTLSEKDVTLVIADGKAAVVHADCPDKLCVGMPPLTEKSPDGSVIVCLPNRVAVIKKSRSNTRSESGVDTVVG